MEQINEFLRINLTNQKNSIHITDMKADFSRRVLSRMQTNLAQTSDSAHDMWQAAKTPKALCSLFSKVSDHIRSEQVKPTDSAYINVENLIVNYPTPDSSELPANIAQQMDIIVKDLEQPRVKPKQTAQGAKKKKGAKASDPAPMPLMERYKLENEAVVLFEAAVEACSTDKDDYVSEICD